MAPYIPLNPAVINHHFPFSPLDGYLWIHQTLIEMYWGLLRCLRSRRPKQRLLSGTAILGRNQLQQHKTLANIPHPTSLVQRHQRPWLCQGIFYIPDFLLSHHGQPAMGYLRSISSISPLAADLDRGPLRLSLGLRSHVTSIVLLDK